MGPRGKLEPRASGGGAERRGTRVGLQLDQTEERCDMDGPKSCGCWARFIFLLRKKLPAAASDVTGLRGPYSFLCQISPVKNVTLRPKMQF